MEKITQANYQTAADLLGLDEVEIIIAVANVETNGDGFLDNGQPKILFERHYFHRLTNGIYDSEHPEISNSTPGGYGYFSEQHEKLQKATNLDREAALKSCSWGKFQIMGANYKLAGFCNLQDFINAMYRNEVEHLLAFVRYVQNTGLVDELRSKAWAGFAYGYNGKNYKRNSYDLKLLSEYNRLKKALN